MNARNTYAGALGAAILCGAAVAGCGGGSSAPPVSSLNSGSGSGTGQPGTSGSSSSRTAQVTISINVPSRASSSSAKRGPSYVSPATTYVQVTAFPDNTVAGSIPCASGTCTGSVAVPLDTTSLEVQLYNAGGQLLSEATEAITITPGVANTPAPFVFNGVATSFPVSSGTTQLVVGVPTTIPIAVTPEDASTDAIAAPGNIIDGSGNVLIGASGAPQTMSLTSSAANVTVGALTFHPANYILYATATYDGGDPGGSEQITLTPQTSVAGDNYAAGALTLPVVQKAIEIVPQAGQPQNGYTITVVPTALPIATTPPATGFATSIEFAPYPTPAAVPVYLSVTANYPVSGTVHLIDNSCESPVAYDYGTITSAFASGPAYSNTTPYNFTVNMQGPPPASPPIANQTCSFTIEDPVTQLQTTATFGFDYYSVYVQGKGRK